MAKNDNLTDFLTDVANAIRTKKGTNDLINPQNFSDEILSIESGKNKMPSFINKTLTELTVEDFHGVTSVSDEVFKNYKPLTKVTIPNGVESIGKYAFSGAGLTNATIASKVIGNYAFSSCSSLTDLLMQEGVTSIENYCFQSCSNLKNVTIPSTLTSFGQSSFNYCKKIAKVNYLGTLEQWCKITYQNPNASPMAYEDTTKELYINGEKITDIAIPNTITTILKYTFMNCSQLRSLALHNYITSIGEKAFYKCTGLTSVIIPSSVTEISYGAFEGCTGLTTITVNRSTPPTLSDTAAIPSTIATINIPKGSLSYYEGATNWSTFTGKFVEV